MTPVTVTSAWRSAHPGALIGLLEISGVDNRAACPDLDARKRALEQRLRERFSG
jgi:hypothetical protein